MSSYNGTLTFDESPKKLTPPQLSPTKEFLVLNSPERHVSFETNKEAHAPATPLTPRPDQTSLEAFTTPQDNKYADSTYGSPTTPYFLHPSKLVQQTCPPKQSQELFFPVSGKIEDHPDAVMRQRLLAARRKSLQFAPRVGSPLANHNI